MGTLNYRLLVRNVRLIAEFKKFLQKKSKDNPSEWDECYSKAAKIFGWSEFEEVQE